MSELLAVLAAVVPILGGIWAAGAALARHRKSRDEMQTRESIESTHERRYEQLMSQRPLRGAEIGFYQSQSRWANSLYQSDLERAGLEPGPPNAQAAAAAALKEPLLSKAQVRDQWLLLSSSAAGVVLLALSLLL